MKSEGGSARNYFEIAVTFLFIILGGIILVRSIRETGLFLGCVMGAAFLGYGAWRLKYVWKFLEDRYRR